MTPTSSRQDVAGRYVVGMDVGGTKINAALADRTGEILSQTSADTNDDGRQLDVQLSRLITDLGQRAEVDPSQVIVTAIGGAGALSETTGEVSKAPNLSELEGRPLLDQLRSNLGHEVLFDNDLNMAALGELHYGIGLTYDDFVAISIGTGVGMGVVVNRQLVRGVHGAAGEIGFLPFGTDPLLQSNQVRGPLEELVSARGLEAIYLTLSGLHRTSREIFELSEAGDDTAARALDELARWTAAAISATVAVLDPAAVVLGGGVGTRPELLNRIIDWLPRYGLPGLEVRVSKLGVHAPVLGALCAANEYADTHREEHS